MFGLRKQVMDGLERLGALERTSRDLKGQIDNYKLRLDAHREMIGSAVSRLDTLQERTDGLMRDIMNRLIAIDKMVRAKKTAKKKGR